MYKATIDNDEKYTIKRSTCQLFSLQNASSQFHEPDYICHTTEGKLLGYFNVFLNLKYPSVRKILFAFVRYKYFGKISMSMSQF